MKTIVSFLLGIFLTVSVPAYSQSWMSLMNMSSIDSIKEALRKTNERIDVLEVTVQRLATKQPGG